MLTNENAAVAATVPNQPVTLHQILALKDLIQNGMKIARLTGNRDIDPKAVKTKKASLKANGLQIPAIIVDATDALKEGLDIEDFLTGETITEANADGYVVLVDANHRFKAHLELKAEDLEYNFEFFLMYPLNTSMKIAKMLAEINIVTNAYKGKDYGKSAKMLCKEELPLLNKVNEFTANGYSLDSACKWLTFKNKVNKAVLADAMDGKIQDCLRFTAGIERGENLLAAAKIAFDENNLKTRTIVDWVIGKYDITGDNKKVELIASIESFFGQLTRSDVKPIEEAKGKRGVSTKEQIIYCKLDEMFNNYLSKMQAA